jgi:hypothetical protein
MKQGRLKDANRHDQLEAALSKAEKEQGVQAVAENMAPTGRKRERIHEDVEKEFFRRLDKPGKTADEWDQLLSFVVKIDALGKAPSEFCSRAVTAIREGRQIAKSRRDDEAVARAGDALVVQVKTVADWRRGGPCPYCNGTGQLEPTRCETPSPNTNPVEKRHGE